MNIMRIIIFIKRRKGSEEGNIEDITDVLTKEHGDDDEDAKAI